MQLTFSRLVEIPLLQQVMENLWQASGLPVGILDPDGNILVATGWQPICTEFHRRDARTLERCRESDAYITSHLAEKGNEEPGRPIEYLCRNGLVDAALPILIEGRHLATLFLGQFFYEPPDETSFRLQARDFGFDEAAYLEALRRVPIFSREKVRAVLAFYHSFVLLLARMGSEKLRRLRAQSLKAEERRLAEETLRQSEEKYRLLFHNDSDAVFLLDAETLDIEEANQAAALLYGYSREDFAGLNLADISAQPQKSRDRIRELQGEGMTRFEILHRKRDGSVFPVEVAHGMFGWKGRQMCVGVVRDISERQEMMRLKDEMLSAVSHEIRTPLTAILGFAEFLRANHDKDVPVAEYLDIVLREGERLKELTDNLLDLQRLRAGFGRKTFRMLEVAPLVTSVAQLFGGPSGRHRFVLSLPERVPMLWGDERQLYRALQNLLSNAVKYSPEGSTIELGVNSEGDFLLFRVRDEGEGIPPEYQTEIFERFFRVDYQRGGPVGGTGLGLALVKAIAEAHRGQVWVESRLGEGSTFVFSIPYARQED